MSPTLLVDTGPLVALFEARDAHHTTVAEAIETARLIAATLGLRLARAREQLVAEVLPLVNDGYLQPGEDPVAREEFIRRATLRGVNADVDGNASFHFDDDEMLWGHRIAVDCDRAGLTWRASVFG